MTLPETITVGLTGHRAAHAEIHRRLNDFFFSVKDYGAACDGVTDDAAAVAEANTAAEAVGGALFFPAGTTLTSLAVVVYSNVYYFGLGPGASTVKLKAGANCDLFISNGFATYTGGSTQSGPSHWGISGLTVDGNGANQTAGPSWCMRVYGSCYRVTDVEFKNGYSGEVWSEWGTSGVDMEAKWEDVKILGQGTVNSHGKGLDWQGPHDSIFTNMIVNSADGFNGIHVHGNAGGEQFLNTHVWGVHDVNWKIEAPIRVYGGVAEGATSQNVLLLTSKVTWHGEIFGTNGTNPTEVGFQLGDATHTSLNANNIDIVTWNWGAGSTPFLIATNADGGNLVHMVGRVGSATNFFSGTVSSKSNMAFVCTDDATKSRMRAGTGIQVFNPLVAAISADGANGQAMRVNTSTNPHALQIGVSSRIQGYTGNFATETFRMDAASGAVQPGTSAGLGARVFSGSGAPTLSATAGDMYIRSDGGAGTWLYRNTGTTTWVAVV